MKVRCFGHTTVEVCGVRHRKPVDSYLEGNSPGWKSAMMAIKTAYTREREKPKLLLPGVEHASCQPTAQGPPHR
jgi:hypothetical protein